MKKLLQRLRKRRARHLALGCAGERDAVRLLNELQMPVLARNWRHAAGELDIVALDGATIVFVEVKTRRPGSAYRPLDNLSPRQLRRNVRAAQAYLNEFAAPDFPCRFDLVEVVRDRRRLHAIWHHADFIPGEIR